MTDDLDAAREALRSASTEEVLGWIERRFGATAAIASSFGPEDIVLLHLAQRHAPSVRVFTLDTGRLPPETYELIEVLRRRFDLELETWFPDHKDLEQLVSRRGHFSFRQSLEDRRECCRLRKVEPLRRALADRSAWVTGMRRDQSSTRAAVEVLEWDVDHGGIAKVNPLANWSVHEVWAYLRKNGLPWNELHDRGYPSIGCAPCTRAVKHHEDERSGRWWWESDEHRECGLHVRAGGGTR